MGIPNSTNLNISDFPSAIIVCDESGLILDANQMAEFLIGRSLIKLNIDDVLDFKQSDLTDCSTIHDIQTQLKARRSEHKVVSLRFNNPPTSHINIHFTFTLQDGVKAIVMMLQDVSERIKLMEAFEYKQNLLDNIVSTSTDALIVFDNYGCIELFSPAAEIMFEKTSTEMIIEDIYSIFDASSHEKVKDICEHLKSIKESDEILVFEDINPVKASGETFPASITFSKSQKDTESLFFMVISDKSLFQRFVNSVNDAYIKTDSQGQIIDINNKAEALFHYDRRTLINKHISFLELKSNTTSAIVNDISLLVNKGDEEEDYITRNRRGNELTLNLTVWPQDVKNVRLNNLIIRDISQKKLAEKQLITSAFTDSLTSLSNRANFNKTLSNLIDVKGQSGKEFALIALDLDKFKYVNDSFGHDYGDELLKASANRLTACIREGDLVSRMGGDEFTIIINNLESADVMERIADRILRNFRRDFSIKEKRLSISTSIGIAFFPKDASTAEDLLKAADMAMYAAKRAGKDNFKYFTTEMFNEYERQKVLEKALSCAIENNELSLHFQPKVSYATNKVVGFEALCRWNHPVLGNVPPIEFIPVAEETGLIISITRWVLSSGIKAIKQLTASLSDNKGAIPTLAINISPDHFKFDILEDIKYVLEAENFDPKLLEIEITEGTLLAQTAEVVEILKSISDLGVQISMDDFGTGYSSLQYLKHFTLNTIKIDRSFVKDIQSDPHNILIIESIVAIAQKFSLKLVAEGVETERELEQLVGLGCDVIQGYFYSKPLPFDEVQSFLGHLETLQKPLFPDQGRAANQR